MKKSSSRLHFAMHTLETQRSEENEEVLVHATMPLGMAAASVEHNHSRQSEWQERDIVHAAPVKREVAASRATTPSQQGPIVGLMQAAALLGGKLKTGLDGLHILEFQV